eukprot:Tbor_TRINITY_DN5612_c1_g1::TRINITY_DN5612_c1_g1_i1::g.8636::m.8636
MSDGPDKGIVNSAASEHPNHYREHKPETVQSIATAYNDLHAYIQAEASLVKEQWSFVAACNEKIAYDFRGVKRNAELTMTAAQEASDLISNLLPGALTDKLEEFERTLAALETVVAGLDEYSMALERRYLH